MNEQEKAYLLNIVCSLPSVVKGNDITFPPSDVDYITVKSTHAQKTNTESTVYMVDGQKRTYNYNREHIRKAIENAFGVANPIFQETATKDDVINFLAEKFFIIPAEQIDVNIIDGKSVHIKTNDRSIRFYGEAHFKLEMDTPVGPGEEEDMSIEVDVPKTLAENPGLASMVLPGFIYERTVDTVANTITLRVAGTVNSYESAGTNATVNLYIGTAAYRTAVMALAETNPEQVVLRMKVGNDVQNITAAYAVQGLEPNVVNGVWVLPFIVDTAGSPSFDLSLDGFVTQSKYKFTIDSSGLTYLQRTPINLQVDLANVFTFADELMSINNSMYYKPLLSTDIVFQNNGYAYNMQSEQWEIDGKTIQGHKPIIVPVIVTGISYEDFMSFSSGGSFYQVSFASTPGAWMDISFGECFPYAVDKGDHIVIGVPIRSSSFVGGASNSTVTIEPKVGPILKDGIYSDYTISPGQVISGSGTIVWKNYTENTLVNLQEHKVFALASYEEVEGFEEWLDGTGVSKADFLANYVVDNIDFGVDAIQPRFAITQTAQVVGVNDGEDYPIVLKSRHPEIYINIVNGVASTFCFECYNGTILEWQVQKASVKTRSTNDGALLILARIPKRIAQSGWNIYAGSNPPDLNTNYTKLTLINPPAG